MINVHTVNKYQFLSTLFFPSLGAKMKEILRKGFPLVQVVVRNNDVERALRTLKKALQNDGFFRRVRLLRYHEKGSDKRLRQREESERRLRKLHRRMESAGY